MTDRAIATLLGQRLEKLRLSANVPQQSIADELGITPKTYRSAVQGNARLEVVIGILRYLGRLDQIDQFIPDEPFSPRELLRMQGRQRRRADGSRANKDTAQDSEW